MGGSDTSSSTTYTSDASSLLFLLFSDVPGVSLVSVPFSGTDFGGLRQNMIVSLSARNKIGFIDGSCPRPGEDTPQFKHWERCNNMGSLDIASYFNKLKKLWDELRFMCTNHANTCICAAKPRLQKEEEENRLHQFLMGLNETYVGVRSNLLMMQPPPSLDTAYGILLQDEKQRQITPNSHFHGDSASFHKVSFDQNKSPLLCKYCKKPGYLVDRCYKLHGFPPNFKFTKGKQTAANVEVQSSGGASEFGPISTESPVDSNYVIPSLSKD
ncbi:uncharacterized protein [Nicotiana sylvestris]|uniref:uncharacterized protein n=1 Tax=Nicotiana sylvestris TaxID=4096 RepID=UPI00388CDEB3